MPLVNYKALLETQLWALLENEPGVTSKVRTGNRQNLKTVIGWLRALMKNPVAGDLPSIKISGGRFTHSGFRTDPTFATEEIDFADPGEAGSFQVRRRIEFVVTVASGQTKTDESDVLEEAIQLALLKAGPKLGLPYVREWGDLTATQDNATDTGSPPRDGKQVTTKLTVPVVIEFSGRELLAEAAAP